MTTPVARLLKGTRSLDLQGGRYGMGTDFNPPPYLASPLFADGTSANRNGAAKIDETPANRTFTFTVNITGSSTAEIQRGISDIQSFLAQAGDENEPLYFAFHPNSDAPEPLWGNTGVWLRYEVVHGSMLVTNYFVGARIATDIDVKIELTVKPFAVGKKQRLASAMGGIAEDNFGASDGISRGLLVPEATTNLFTNPVFGNATYSTNWTIGSNLTAAQNTDKKFVLPGCVNSMRVYARNTTNNTVTESLTLPASSHNITAYVMLPDLTAPSATQLQIYYNSAAQTTTYEAIGNNGLYRCYATVTGTGGALATGVVIKNKYTVYLLGLQVEAKAYPTPLCWGDLLGCSWSGTAHASTSTRAVAKVKLPVASDTVNIAAGTIAVTVKISQPNTAPNYHYIFWGDGASALRAFYDYVNDYFKFEDGSNTCVTPALTFSPGTIYTLHFVYGPSGLVIYTNGVAGTPAATYAPPTGTAYLYIGTDSSGTFNSVNTTMDFRTFDVPLTAAQVAADYANVSQLTADNQRVGCVPWLWTKDGDDVVDNCTDSTRNNWAVCGGVPGSAEAETAYSLIHSATYGSTIGIGVLKTKYFINPSNLFFESGGTADGGASNGDVAVTSISTASEVSISSIANLSVRAYEDLAEKEIVASVRLKDAGANLKIKLQLSIGTKSYTSSYKTGIASTHTNLFIPSVVFPKIDTVNLSFSGSILLYIKATRSSGGANDVACDYFMLMPRPFVLIDVGDTGTVFGWGAYETRATGGVTYKSGGVIGDVINMTPDEQNIMLFSAVGENAAPSDNSVSATTTLSRVLIIPRYQLL